MTPQEEAGLASIKSLVEHLDAVREKADDALEPIVKRVAATGDIDQMWDLYNRLPRGFYKSELLVRINTEVHGN